MFADIAAKLPPHPRGRPPQGKTPLETRMSMARCKDHDIYAGFTRGAVK
jgi:hypothetical protein